MTAPKFSGRCYCGAIRLSSDTDPITVATCHCSDCRRVSGAPVSTFAAFETGKVTFMPSLDAGVSHAKGVRRWFCRACGTPLAATYDYLPDQLYIPVGLFDQVNELPPQSHSHTGSRVAWVELDASLPQDTGSARDILKAAHGDPKD